MTYADEYRRIDEALTEAGLGVGASEAHGLLSAQICFGEQANNWKKALFAEKEIDCLDEVYTQSKEELESPEFEFQLLIPEEASIQERAQALSAWCYGFITARGLLNIATSVLGDDIKEALLDLEEISKLDYQDIPDNEEAEMMMVELSEFVRTIAMIIYTSCHQKKKLH